MSKKAVANCSPSRSVLSIILKLKILLFEEHAEEEDSVTEFSFKLENLSEEEHAEEDVSMTAAPSSKMKKGIN